MKFTLNCLSKTEGYSHEGKRHDYDCTGIETQWYTQTNNTFGGSAKTYLRRVGSNSARTGVVNPRQRNRSLPGILHAQKPKCKKAVKVFVIWDELWYNDLNEKAPMLVAQQSGAHVSKKG